jgi:hypothetical protein
MRGRSRIKFFFLIYHKYNANGVNMCSICGGTASADYRDVMARLEECGIHPINFFKNFNFLYLFLN